jgi:prevent-host-death family protein
MESSMKPLKLSENVIPVSEFKARAADWLRRLSEDSAPLVITQNGKAAAVVLAPADYDELTERARFVQAVEAGLADVEAGRIKSHTEVLRLLSDRLKAPGES